MSNLERESIHFVTGRLAEASVREIVTELAERHGFEFTIDVLPITVAALMTPSWLLRHISIPSSADRIILPGYLAPHLDAIRNQLAASFECSIECGPKDVRDLPVLFGNPRHRSPDYGEHRIEIIAEINYAPRLSPGELIERAEHLQRDGADRIDLGCEPGHRWTAVADTVKRMIDLGFTVSIDSFDPWEVAQATHAGASLVLSVNSKNRDQAADWGVEVVAIPDVPSEMEKSLHETIEALDRQRIPLRIDPILEPIGCGFAASLDRYYRVRQWFPEAPIMMGIGNLTELTDCDSAGINTLLLGYCEELQITSVLTTEVIPWAQSSVRECDLARRLVAYSVRHQVPPKHLEERLVMLRDPLVHYPSPDSLRTMALNIRDHNFRIAIDGNNIHLMSAGVHLEGTDPFLIVGQLMEMPQWSRIDPSHAFYLGFELSKALTALTLGKRYDQDEALRWGMHTREEKHHRLPRKKRHTSDYDSSDEPS